MERAKLLNAIIENAIDGIITIDERGIIENVNKSALELFGYESSELVGQNVKILMPSPHFDKHDNYIANYRETGNKRIIGIGREVMGKKKDGSLFLFRLGVSEVNFADKRIFTGFIHDLTKQKEAEQQIKSYTEELENKIKERTMDLVKLIGELEAAKEHVNTLFEKERELSQLKTKFVSMASHEFRTPLSAMQLSATLIDKYAVKNDAEAIGKHTTKIKNAIANLTNILNDFLSHEKLEAGIVTVNRQWFDIEFFVKDLAEEMQMICKKGQVLTFTNYQNEKQVFLDQNLLRNALINLVSNAIKYSGENTDIEITTQVIARTLKLVVKDNGIGIPPADTAHLFEPFFRAHNIGDIPGTGLGLHIVKRYVTLMEGAIKCESALNKGTTFFLDFSF